jgi:hypothetical protein
MKTTCMSSPVFGEQKGRGREPNAARAGLDRVFWFRPGGANERGLAVMEIDDDDDAVISPAPRSFAAG